MCVLGSLPIIIGYIHVLLVMVLCRDMASSVALVMAPLLPWICSCVVNMGFKMGCQGGWVQGGGGFKGKGSMGLISILGSLWRHYI